MESQAPYRTLQPGEMLNWYRIERILGRGGFGVIYLATDTNLDHQVAIKEYIPSDVATRSGDSKVLPITEEHGDIYRWGMDRFIKEARNLVKFKHPNIVRVMSVFQENNTAYMVMEFEEGHDLRAHLRKPGATSEQSLKQLIIPVSKGLAEVHRHGFVHRDIKPANILVRSKDGSPVLIDFGSARNASKFTQQSLTALVSVGYAPLEQYNTEGDEQQGPWTDIYALGGTLYYAITGRDPIESTRRGAALFNGGTDPLISAERLGEGKFSVSFLRAIDWALQFRIADRPQSLSDWIPAVMADDDLLTPEQSRYGGPVSRIPAVRPGVDTKVMDDLADATVLSRERQTLVGANADKSRGALAQLDAPGKGVRWFAGLALLLSFSALGYWVITNKIQTDDSGLTSAVQARSDDALREQERLSEVQRQVAIDQQQREQQQAELLQQQQAERDALQQKEADLAAEAKRREQARLDAKAAADAAIVAKEAAEESARVAALAAQAEAQASAERKARLEQERVRAAQLAEQQAANRLERRLNRAIIAAQNSLNFGDHDAANKQLLVAQSLSPDDARVETLALAVEAAIEKHNRPVSDADFDTVTRMFDAMRRAIENKDELALDRLASTSQQSVIFKSLMKNFERLDVSINDIRVRNVDKSITGTLRIDAMVRQNGDRATPSDKYATRSITSRRLNGGWSKIEW